MEEMEDFKINDDDDDKMEHQKRNASFCQKQILWKYHRRVM